VGFRAVSEGSSHRNRVFWNFEYASRIVVVAGDTCAGAPVFGEVQRAGQGSQWMTAAPVQETVQDLSKAIVFEWSARVCERLAVALESVATTMLSGVEASISQSMARIDMLTKPQDGKPAVVSGWPKNDGVVPNSFAPSPVEFFLEDHATWPDSASRLIGKSLGDTAGLPIDPVEAARLLLIRGGFGGDGNEQIAINPLIWAAPSQDWRSNSGSSAASSYIQAEPDNGANAVTATC